MTRTHRLSLTHTCLNTQTTHASMLTHTHKQRTVALAMILFPQLCISVHLSVCLTSLILAHLDSRPYQARSGITPSVSNPNQSENLIIPHWTTEHYRSLTRLDENLKGGGGGEECVCVKGVCVTRGVCVCVCCVCVCVTGCVCFVWGVFALHVHVCTTVHSTPNVHRMTRC